MRAAREAAAEAGTRTLVLPKPALVQPSQAFRQKTQPHPSAAPVFDFAVVADRTAFEALAPEWNDLFERSGRPHQVFQTFAWLWIWANHYCDKRVNLAIVIGRSEGRLALVWPLVKTRRFGLSILSFMGEPVSQYGDALVDDREDPVALTAQALAFVKSLPADIVSLRRVRDDAALAATLARGAERTGAPSRAPFVDFAGAPDAAAFEKRFSAKLRSDRRRRLRQLEDLGPVTFERHGPGPRAHELAEIGLAFKQDWARRSGRFAPALADPRFRSFFVDAAGGGPHDPGLRVVALSCGGAPVGVELSVVCKGCVFGHVLAASPGFEKQGAGAILAGRSLVDALEQGSCAYDLLAPADPYKMEWASGCVGVSDYALPRTLSGRLYKRLWLDFGRRAARALARRLAPHLRRLAARRA